MSQKFRVKQVRIKSELADRSGLVTENMTSATPDKEVGTTFKNVLVDENWEFVVWTFCSIDEVTQPQADTLTLEDLRVTVCGTWDVDIDGKTVSLDKVAWLFWTIVVPPSMWWSVIVSDIKIDSADLQWTWLSDWWSPIFDTWFVIYESWNPTYEIWTPWVSVVSWSWLTSPFTWNATWLTDWTQYCVRSYATNVWWTWYSTEQCFTTMFMTSNYIYTTEYIWQVRKYDKDTYALVTSISVGTDPYWIVYNPDTWFIYVWCTWSNRIDIIGTSDTVVWNIALAWASRLYISDWILFAIWSSSIIRVDLSTNTITHTITKPAWGWPKTWWDNWATLYIWMEVSWSWIVYKYTKSNLAAAWTVNTWVPSVVSVNFDGSWNWYVSWFSNGITEKYNSSDSLVWSVITWNTNQACRISPDGQYLYNPRSSFSQYQKINTTTWAVISSVSTNPIPVWTFLYPDWSKLIVCFNTWWFQVFDTASWTLLWTWAGSAAPFAIYTY